MMNFPHFYSANNYRQINNYIKYLNIITASFLVSNNPLDFVNNILKFNQHNGKGDVVDFRQLCLKVIDRISNPNGSAFGYLVDLVEILKSSGEKGNDRCIGIIRDTDFLNQLAIRIGTGVPTDCVDLVFDVFRCFFITGFRKYISESFVLNGISNFVKCMESFSVHHTDETSRFIVDVLQPEVISLDVFNMLKVREGETVKCPLFDYMFSLTSQNRELGERCRDLTESYFCGGGQIYKENTDYFNNGLYPHIFEQICIFSRNIKSLSISGGIFDSYISWVNKVFSKMDDENAKKLFKIIDSKGEAEKICTYQFILKYIQCDLISSSVCDKVADADYIRVRLSSDNADVLISMFGLIEFLLKEKKLFSVVLPPIVEGSCVLNLLSEIPDSWKVEQLDLDAKFHACEDMKHGKNESIKHVTYNLFKNLRILPFDLIYALVRHIILMTSYQRSFLDNSFLDIYKGVIAEYSETHVREKLHLDKDSDQLRVVLLYQMAHAINAMFTAQ